MACLKVLRESWRNLVIILVPFVAIPILYIDDSDTKAMAALYGLSIMASYWITEALPLSVTALLPMVIFPLLGVAPPSSVASNYIKDSSLFGFVCLAFSVCVEKWSLHRRIALNIIKLMGSAPKWLMLGFMAPTWFLSLWVNNTSATAMMLPIVSAVLSNLNDIRAAANEESSHDVTDDGLHEKTADNGKGDNQRINVKKGDDPDVNGQHADELMLVKVQLDPSPNRQKTESNLKMRKAMTICICYAATVGGIGSMAGTSTNIIMQGQAEDFFKFYGLESGVNYLSWMLCCLPISVICLLLAWAWLVLFFFGFRELFKWEWGDKAANQRTRKTIQKFLDEMGPMKFAEKAVLFHFALLVVLMLSMKLPGGSGWVLLFKSGFVKNSVPAILVLVATFIFPSQWPQKENNKGRPSPALLQWQDIQNKLPWGTVILMGGGYALAFVVKDSGLSSWIGVQLSILVGRNPPWVVSLILSLAISFMTEVTSNAATATILCPILAQLAVTLRVHPLYFLFPGALSCSLAFMLPVATPPNTLVFATGDIRVKDMIQVGFFLNVFCVCVVNLAINSWMSVYFDLDTMPLEMMGSPSASMTTTNVTRNTTEYSNDDLYNGLQYWSAQTTTVSPVGVNLSSWMSLATVSRVSQDTLGFNATDGDSVI